MKNTNCLVPVLAILVCLSLSCTYLRTKLSGGEKPATEFIAIAKAPPRATNVPLASPGAFVIRRLAEQDPSVAAIADQIEASERRAMQQIIDSRPETGSTKETALSPPQDSVAQPLVLAFAAPRLLMFQAGRPQLPGIHDGAFVGMLTGEFKSMFAGIEAGDFHKRDSKTEVDKATGTTTTVNVEADLGADGSTGFGMGVKTETIKNGVKVTTEMQAKVDGQDCPNADGQVPITLKMRLSGQSGGASYAQDVTLFIRIVVNDNADIAETTIDVTQGTTRGKEGREVFVESGWTIRYANDIGKATESNEHLTQKTDNASFDDVRDLSESGRSTAYGAAIGVIQAAERAWQNGGCIKIDAKPPGQVATSSTTSIPVKVVLKKDRSEIPAKVDVTLTGGASIDPSVIPKTAGTLNYVAPAEIGKAATIHLAASSKRGRAKLDLDASTGGAAYRIVGGLAGWQTNSKVCDIMKPFTLTGILSMKFSGGMSGTKEYSGGPFNANGKGTYTISLPDGLGKPGTMTSSVSGQITGDKVYKGSGVEKYTLTPIEPCN